MEIPAKLTPLFRAKVTNPTKDHWLSAGGTGITGLSYTFNVTKSYVSVELTISKATAEENKRMFDELRKYESQISSQFGGPISWERLDNRKMCRIACYKEGVSLFEKAQWDVMIAFHVEKMIGLENALKEPLKTIKRRIRELEGDGGNV